MTTRSAGVVVGAALLIALSACGSTQPAADPSSAALSRDDQPAEALTREAQLPSTAETTTLTTRSTVPVDPIEADRQARTLIRQVASAADEAYAESGTYEVDRDTISSLAGGVEVISLEEAAVAPGVAYDPFGQRVTLHLRSSSGRWFCLDLSPDGRDHGFGDTFATSLASCTDGVGAAGWGDAFSPSGPDEASIAGLWESLASALEAGDPAAAHQVFSARTACPLSRLELVWPAGVSLLTPAEFSLEAVSVLDASAVSDITLGSLPAPSWRLEKNGAVWSLAADPCREFEELARQRTDAAARQLLEEGLFAVQSVFVVELDFAFGPDELGPIDPDLVWVELEDLEFGLLSYSGRLGTGVVATKGASTFLCAVESATAATRFGEGADGQDVGSATACSTAATSSG